MEHVAPRRATGRVTWVGFHSFCCIRDLRKSRAYTCRCLSHCQHLIGKGLGDGSDIKALMAQAPTGQPDFDFWDFVNCSICHLPFGPENGGPPQVPFWLTDCGHIICNSHLSQPTGRASLPALFRPFARQMLIRVAHTVVLEL